MLGYVLRRVLQLLPTSAGVLLLTFVLFHAVGGSPAEVALGQHANAASLAAFDARYGYDKPLVCGIWAVSRAWSAELAISADGTLHPLFPLTDGTWRVSGDKCLFNSVEVTFTDGTIATNLFSDALAGTFVVPSNGVCTAILGGEAAQKTGFSIQKRANHFFDSQLLHYVVALLNGDLGDSTAYGMRVADVLRAGIVPSLTITVPILFGGTIVALLLAMTSAVWRGKWPDKTVLFGSTFLMSVNYVVWILAGQFLLAFKLKLFPIWGFESAAYVVLPVIIGIFSGLGRDIRFFRTVLLDEMNRPYVRTAVAKGLSHRRVLWGHVFRNSLIPITTYTSLSIPYLFTGSLLLESFFGIPGLGGVSLNAINSADMATVRAVVILGALLYQIVNLLTDICYAWLDPRVKL